MDRNVVIATVLIALIMVVWLTWLAPPAPPPIDPAALDSTVTAVEPDIEREPVFEQERPAAALLPVVTDSTFLAATVGEERLITVETDLYEAVFSTKGATPVSFLLKTYERADHDAPVQMIDTSKVGALGLVFTTPASHLIDTRALYFEVETTGDRLAATDAPVELAFTARIGAGTIRQTYTFTPGEYEVGLRVEQVGAETFSTQEGYEIAWNGGIPFSEGDAEQEAQRAGAFARSGGEIEGVDLGSDAYEEQSLRGAVDWVAIKSKYFMAAIIPEGETRGAELIGERHGETDLPGHWEDYTVGLLMPSTEAGSEAFRLYIGPMEYYRIAAYDLGLYDTVDYGWDAFEWMTRTLARYVFIPAFTFLGKFIPNYGIIIIIIAIAIKIVVYPLTKSSYKSMAKMRELQPKMEAIKEKHGDNPQKQQEAMMKMYKETGVNPIGGCLPMLLQYPIIIALWQYLPQSIQIRQQGFLWADDLSAPDVILNLPFDIPLYGSFVAGFTLLMGLSMVVQMKIQMASQPSTPQTKIFTYVMPVMIFAIFNKFAAGLSLYYLCYNILTAAQQKFINSSMEKEKEAKTEHVTAWDAKKAKTNGHAGGKKSKSKRVRS